MEPMTRKELLEELDAASQEGTVAWEIESDNSGGGKLTVVYTPDGGTRQSLEWALTPIGGLPEAPSAVVQAAQVEPMSAGGGNPDTSQSGTAMMGTNLDVGLGLRPVPPA